MSSDSTYIFNITDTYIHIGMYVRKYIAQVVSVHMYIHMYIRTIT